MQLFKEFNFYQRNKKFTFINISPKMVVGWKRSVVNPSDRGGEGEGGMTVIHILIGMFNSNPMIPQYLNNNLT